MNLQGQLLENKYSSEMFRLVKQILFISYYVCNNRFWLENKAYLLIMTKAIPYRVLDSTDCFYPKKFVVLGHFSLA